MVAPALLEIWVAESGVVMGKTVVLEELLQGELIERVHASEFTRRRFIQDFFMRSKPLIIEGATADWKASSWTLDNVSQYIPDQSVSVRNKPDGVLFDANSMAHEAVDIPLHQYLHLLRSGKNETPMYLAQTNLAGLLSNPEIYAPRFKYLRRADYLLQTNIWIGTPGLATPCHYDFAHNFYHQICGHKHITLFSPEDSARLYPNPKIPAISLVDVASPDAEKFPDFKNTRPLQFVVGPGDSVFIPAGWWHYVASTYDNNISINQWYLRLWSRNTHQLKMIPPMIAHGIKHLLASRKR